MSKKKQVPPTIENITASLAPLESVAHKSLGTSFQGDDVATLYSKAFQLIEDTLNGKVEPTSDRLALAKFIVTQTEGKGGTKEVKQKATSIIVKLAIPGCDDEVNSYLASLDDDVLAAYEFDEDTLAAIALHKSGHS